ncbi:unnamed protein product [Sphagnum balticum]
MPRKGALWQRFRIVPPQHIGLRRRLIRPHPDTFITCWPFTLPLNPIEIMTTDRGESVFASRIIRRRVTHGLFVIDASNARQQQGKSIGSVSSVSKWCFFPLSSSKFCLISPDSRTRCLKYDERARAELEAAVGVVPKFNETR